MENNFLEELPVKVISKKEFLLLSEYSLSLPMNKNIGFKWKAYIKRCWVLGIYIGKTEEGLIHKFYNPLFKEELDEQKDPNQDW